MSDPALTSGQYSIGKLLPGGDSSALVYGRGAGSIQVQNTAVDPGSLLIQDTAVVGHDGVLFGVDTLPGMVVTQQGLAMTTPVTGVAALDAYGVLAGKWNDPNVRLQSGVMQVLRASYPGSSVIRRTVGRGRAIVPSYGQVFTGLVPFTAAFQSADNTWYEEVLNSVVLTMVPSATGTFTPPATPPFVTTYVANNQQGVCVVGGNVPTWPVITFNGPIYNPSVQFSNGPVTIGFTGSVPAGQSLVIDTNPWARTCMLQGASVAGALTGSSMINLQLQVGSTTIRMSGQDYTGTSTCIVAWRNAMMAIGGSV